VTLEGATLATVISEEVIPAAAAIFNPAPGEPPKIFPNFPRMVPAAIPEDSLVQTSGSNPSIA